MGISLSHLCVWHFKYSMKQQGGLPTVHIYGWHQGWAAERSNTPFHTHLSCSSLPGSLLSPLQLMWLCWLKSATQQPASSGLKFAEPRAGPYSGALSLFLLKGQRGWGQRAGREEGAPFGCSAGWYWLKELLGTAWLVSAHTATREHSDVICFSIIPKHASALWLCRDLHWGFMEVPLSSKLFPCSHQLARTPLVYKGNENWEF